MAGAVQMRWWQWDSDCMMSAMLETQWFLLTLYYVCRCCFYRVTEHVRPQIVTFVMLVEKNVQNTHSTFRIRWAIKKINIHAMYVFMLWGLFYFLFFSSWLLSYDWKLAFNWRLLLKDLVLMITTESMSYCLQNGHTNTYHTKKKKKTK